jgi:hypothetical protein
LKAKNNRDTGSFSWSQISNSNLLPANEDIYKKIKSANIGDQVSFSGYLVDYSYDIGKGEWRRITSTIREDTGNGACEIIYVSNFVIIKKANLPYHIAFQISKYAFIICLILLFILTGRSPLPPKPPSKPPAKLLSILPEKITKY